jgi:hypothetical protein
MPAVNLNNSEDFVKEFKVFNDGKAGVVENVRMRVEKKPSTDDEKKPMYKLIGADDKGEVNEGFYYCEPDSKAFNNYQAQRLIQLARGVLGKDVKFPVFDTPKDTLDGVMKMVAPELIKKSWRVAVCYGTIKRRESFLGFKSFGSFIQPMAETNTLEITSGDSTIRAPQEDKSTPAETLISSMDLGDGKGKNLDWLKEG